MQVVRCFEDENVIHVAGKVDPVEDTDVINFELALSDITQIEKRLQRLEKGRAKTKEEIASNEVLLQSFCKLRNACALLQSDRSVLCASSDQVLPSRHSPPFGQVHELLACCMCRWRRLRCRAL